MCLRRGRGVWRDGACSNIIFARRSIAEFFTLSKYKIDNTANSIVFKSKFFVLDFVSSEIYEYEVTSQSKSATAVQVYRDTGELFCSMNTTVSYFLSHGYICDSREA